jgi:hypothetical protein
MTSAKQLAPCKPGKFLGLVLPFIENAFGFFALVLLLVLRVHLLGRGVNPLASCSEAVVGVLA